MANAASDKKGIDIVMIKMRKISGICDYFVIVSGTSTTHVRAISDNIVKKLREKGSSPRHIEGDREASWILIDFGDVVGHIFLEKTRKFYDLEKLWAKAPQTRFEEEAPSLRKPAKKTVRRVAKKRISKPARKAAGKKAGRRSRKKSKR
ncbi:MAG: ribosome silencing factor [Candidatus Omnitrophota bacterium]